MKLLWVLRRWAKDRLCAWITVIESCDICGRHQPLVWWADDELWQAVVGRPGGVRCPECFDREAARRGLGVLYWHVTARAPGGPWQQFRRLLRRLEL